MTTTDERERELQAFLHQRADLVDVPGDFAPSAIAKRHRDLRNRAVLGAVAAVAVVAVAVPAVWSRQGPGPSPAPATSTPTSATSSTSVPTQTATTPPVTGSATEPPVTRTSPPATGVPGGVPTKDSDAAPATSLELAFGPLNGTSDVAYALAGVLHDGGGTLKLPVASGIQYLARLENGGALVHAPADGRAQSTFVIDGSGATVARLSDVQDVRAKADGSQFATVDMSGTLHLRDSAGRELATLATDDPNTSVSGWDGDIVYYMRVDADGRSATRAWDPRNGTTRAITSGRFQAIHEGRGLAILWPNQDYDPGNTCYGMYDLRARRALWWSCGTFAPSHFGAGGTVVVGPEVADGPGSSGFKMASADDGRILARIALVGGAWSPAWVGHDSRALMLTLLNRESPTKQTLASCSVSGECSVDLDAAPVTAGQRDTMEWPITLSDN